jgi:hypothetical protein
MTMLLLQHGKNHDFVVLVTDEAGEPRDITGVDLHFMAKAHFADLDGDAVIDLTTPTEIEILDQVTTIGRATIHVPDSAVNALASDRNHRLMWECQAEEGADRWPVDAGVLLVVPGVIQA